jgi:hypothetical protein
MNYSILRIPSALKIFDVAMNRTLITGTLVLALAALLFTDSASQDASKIDEPNDPNDALFSFSIASEEDYDLMVRGRQLAIGQCWHSLDARARCETHEERTKFDGDAARAADLAGKLRAKELTDELCSNLTLPDPGAIIDDWIFYGPLIKYPAARALVDIGGPEAAKSVLFHLKHKLERTELLLCGHVLVRLDDPKVTLERLRLAKEASRLEDPPEVREVFWDNLAQVKQWLEDPDFDDSMRLAPAQERPERGSGTRN